MQVMVLILVACNDSHAKEIFPGDDLCGEINSMSGGGEIVLNPGRYQGPCKIRRGGTSAVPLVIRAADLSRPPQIYYEGRQSNVLEVYADYVVIRGVEFAETRKDVDGIRVIAGNVITIEDCKFLRMGGIAIVSNHTSVRGLTIRRNVIVDSLATAMYFGCHDGSACKISELLVENNFIAGVSAPDPEIGYGIQVKLNSAGIVRDNVIVRTKGPGIMVYGTHDLSVANVIQGNFTSDSRTSSGIVVGGGPAHVFNNISVYNREAGIAIQDYAGRGLLRNISIEHNTIYNNSRGGIVVHAQREIDAVISKNALASQPGTPILTPMQNGLKMFANQDCSANNCFMNPEQRDFTPQADSPLNTARKGNDRSRNLDRDYFGSRRPPHAAVGAIERPGGMVILGIKH